MRSSISATPSLHSVDTDLHVALVPREEGEDERPPHALRLPGLRIARYPITNARFRTFWETGGYEDERWW